MMLVTAAGGLADAGEPAGTTVATTSTVTRLGGAVPADLVVAVSPTADGGYLVSASAGDLVFRKVVYDDGRFHAQIERGTDRIVFTGGRDRVHVTYGSESLTRLHADQGETQALRIRTMLVHAPVVAAFRRLIADLEEQDALSPELLSLRMTGAFVAELDGDVGAARRLNRALMRSLGLKLRKAQDSSKYPPDCWSIYVKAVLKASYELEECSNAFSGFNPTRGLCAFYWTLQVEAAWFALLGCSAVPIG
jgi:hypothetical protein